MMIPFDDIEPQKTPVQQGPPVYTLSTLAGMVGQAVSNHPVLRGAWVMAEISDLRSSGGHLYMELIEKDANGATVARMRATMWAGVAARLRRKFMSTTGRDLASGLKVMLFGAVNHHSIYGLSFNIGEIDPSYTLGDLERQRREILERLSREGILEMQKRLPIPAAPQKIAVISAAGAAGYGDFTNHLESSPEGFRFYPMLFPAVLQGEKTASSVCAALDRIEQAPDFWDAVVIIRGGGATSDLNGFDNYELARRVVLCPLPVIVGIGHERDRTVLDEIAAVRCKTPTAVANWLIDTLREALDRSLSLTSEIVRFATDRISGDSRRLEGIRSLLPPLVGAVLTGADHRLARLASGLAPAVGGATAKARMRLAGLESELRHAAVRAMENRVRRVDELAAKLVDLPSERLGEQSSRLQFLEQMVGALSPANTLKRGYSITRLNGRALRDPGELKPGDILVTTLSNGQFESRV